MRRPASLFAIIMGLVVLLPQSSQPLSSGAASLVGAWSGSLDLQGSSLPLIFHITMVGKLLRATMDSPSQGAEGIACSGVSLENGFLRLDIDVLKGGFRGLLAADGNLATGSWSQGGASLPLVLVKGKDSPHDPRPQTPRPPFPYRALELSFPGGAPGVLLSATILIPAGKGPFPAVVLVTGSGPQDRDETILGHKPFLVIADYLARRGIAVLRYDDRGVASSRGDYAAATTRDFAADAMAAVGALAGRGDIDRERVGMVGHSEGGLVAPMVASTDAQLRFIVLLAGPALKGSDLLLLQSAALARAMGSSDEAIARNLRINARLYAIAASPGDTGVTAEAIRTTYLGWIDAESGLSAAERDEARRSADAVTASLASPWMHCFLDLDPASFLGKLTIPVLALGGTKDLQVPVDENFAAMARAFAADGSRSSLTLRKFVGLNHLFQHAATGLPSEYGGITETIAPEVLVAMADWILAR